MPKRIDPLRGYTLGACIMRFCIGLFLGLLFALLLVLVLHWCMRVWVPPWPTVVVCILVVLPVAWGILSVFWLERMSNTVRDIFGP